MMLYEDLLHQAQNLPAAAIADRVNDTLSHDGSAVVMAPPGAGKSTLLPLTILLGLQPKGKILMLEPRRLAARQIAERMSALLGEPVGQTVGYRIRFESKVSAQTRIEVLTEGILTRMLISDPTLDGVSAIIFDEFHERSIHTDLAIALTRHLKAIIRPDLKMVVMSATIDAQPISKALHAPIVECQGRMFPVAIHNITQDIDSREVAIATAEMVMKAHERHEGDILVFLPGQNDILRCQELLSEALAPTKICPLYGNLPAEEQRKAIAASAAGERKVVLATPIAETSLTIEGVRIVVDSGLFRKLVFDPRNGLSHLETTTISMDMATQRAGRAGRVAEGVCYRLWSTALEHRMENIRKPEIVEADLAPMLLEIAALNEGAANTLPWITPPPPSSIAHGVQLLQNLNALDSEQNITALGVQMAQLPSHPRISSMMLHASTNEEKSIACDIAALIEEKDPMTDSTIGIDMSYRINALRKARAYGNPGRWNRIVQVSHQYHTMIKVKGSNTPATPHAIGALTAFAYPERVAMALDHIGTYRLASGEQVKIDNSDPLTAFDWISIASMYASASNKNGNVFLASPVDMNDIKELCRNKDIACWDSKMGAVTIQQECRIGKLTVYSKPIRNIDNDLISNIVCEAVAKEGLSILNWDNDTMALQRRVAQVAQWAPDLNLPDISTESLMADAKSWLPPYLNDGNKTKCTATELHKIKLTEVLWALLSYEQQKAVDHLAPTHITVPTGSKIKIDYRAGSEAPVLSVRLQECFGLSETPRVNNGKQPLLMELLSPGFKPVQLTQDLASFWKNAYFEVRKELRRRYPKHYWPDNPLEAEAVRGVKRK